jgi:hypothetical protein
MVYVYSPIVVSENVTTSHPVMVTVKLTSVVKEYSTSVAFIFRLYTLMSLSRSVCTTKVLVSSVKVSQSAVNAVMPSSA